jgi:hypothetical protein
MVDRILTAARRLSPASPAASWIAAWALAGRGWRTSGIAQALGTDHRSVILAIARVRNTPEFLALASSLLRSRLSGDCAHDDICRRADRPDLTEPEWNVLVQAGERWAEETDIDAGVRWGRLLAVPGRNERFLKKLLELGPAAQIAVIDYIERYWAAQSRNETLPAFPGRSGAREPTAARASSRK